MPLLLFGALRKIQSRSATRLLKHELSKSWETAFDGCNRQQQSLIRDRLTWVPGIKLNQWEISSRKSKCIEEAILVAKELIHVTKLPTNFDEKTHAEELQQLAESVGQGCVITEDSVGFIAFGSAKNRFINRKIVVPDEPLSPTSRHILETLFDCLTTDHFILTAYVSLLEHEVFAATFTKPFHRRSLRSALREPSLVALKCLSQQDNKLCGVFFQNTNATGWVVDSLKKLLSKKGILQTSIHHNSLAIYFDKRTEALAKSMVRINGSYFEQWKEYHGIGEYEYRQIIEQTNRATITLNNAAGGRVAFLGPSESDVQTQVKKLYKLNLLSPQCEVPRSNWGTMTLSNPSPQIPTNVSPDGWVGRQICKLFGGAIIKAGDGYIFTPGVESRSTTLPDCFTLKGEVFLYRSNTLPSPPKGVTLIRSDDKTQLAMLGDAAEAGTYFALLEESGCIRRSLLPEDWNKPIHDIDYQDQLGEELALATAEAVTAKDKERSKQDEDRRQNELRAARERQIQLQEHINTLLQVARQLKSNNNNNDAETITNFINTISDHPPSEPSEPTQQQPPNLAIAVLRAAESLRSLVTVSVDPLLQISHQFQLQQLPTFTFTRRPHSFWDNKLRSLYKDPASGLWCGSSLPLQVDIQILKSIPELKNVTAATLDVSLLLGSVLEDGRVYVFDTSSLLHLCSSEFPQRVKIVVPYTALSELRSLTYREETKDIAQLAYHTLCEMIMSTSSFGTTFVIGPVQEYLFFEDVLKKNSAPLKLLTATRNTLSLNVPDDRILACARWLKSEIRKYRKNGHPPPVTLFSEDIELSSRADYLQLGTSRPPLVGVMSC